MVLAIFHQRGGGGGGGGGRHMNVAFDSTPVEILTRFEYPANTWRRNNVNATSV